MTEYAKLVLSVDSTSATQSATALGKLESAGKSAERGMSSLEQQTRRNAQSASALGAAMKTLGATIAATVSVSALQSVAGMVQGYQEMAERVRMASASTAEFEMVQKRLLATANGTYRSLGEAQELYIRTADSLRSLGYTTAQALDVTDSMSYAFVTNAANAERAGAAISAFAKSMNTGKVAADQWETITTAIPTVINAIAEASGKSAEQVRALGAAGKLTARDLSEGLRKSLEENSQAAANMASNMVDAGVRARTALTAMFVAIEERSGVIQGVTDSIIGAADAVLELSQDSVALRETLEKVGTAAEVAGAVIAARLVTSMAAYAAAQGQAVLANIERVKSENAALTASARRAAVEKTAAFNALATARAEFEAARGTNAHALAANALIAAQGRAAQAAATHAAAQTALNGVMTAGTVVARGFAGAMALLGGPAGVVLMAASAVAAYALSASQAKQPTDDLTKSVRDLTSAQRDLAKFEAIERLQKLGEQANKISRDIEGANALMRRSDVNTGNDQFQRALAERKVALEAVSAEIATYQKRLDELNNYRPSAPSPAIADQEPAAPTTSVEGQKRLQQMRDERDLAKLSGEAKAKLQAIQKLGAEATKEEREEAEKLAVEIYKLEEAQKAAIKSKKALSKAFSDDASTKLLLSLREQESVLKEQLSGSEKLTAQQRAQAEWAQQLADIKEKKILTAEQKSLLQNAEAITAQIEKNAALGEEVRLHQEGLKLQERAAQIAESISGSRENRRDEYAGNLAAFGQGSAAQQQAAAAADIFKEFRRYQDQLNKNTPKDLLGSEQYIKARSQIADGLREALAEHEEYYRRINELQSSSWLGAQQALNDYSDNARNVYGQTAALVGSTMESLTDGLSESLTTAIMHGEDLRESMAALGETIIESVLKSLIEMGIQYGINSALEIAGITAVSGAKVAAAGVETTAEVAKTTATSAAEVAAAGTVATAKIAAITATTAASTTATATTTATQTAAAATTAAAWTPAAIVSSIGSFGVAAAVGLAAVIAALAFTGGFRKGGYTGNGGVNEVAGAVHGQEYVFDAAATKRIGVANLDALRAGRTIASDSVSSGVSASGSPSTRRGDVIVNQTINTTGRIDNRTSSQMNADAGRSQRMAQARLGK